MPSITDKFRTLDPVLTSLAQGYTNATLVADALFPVVDVSMNKAKIPIFNKTAFIARDTNRAIGAKSNRIPQTDFELLPFETTERDIEMAVDYLEADVEDNIIRLEKKLIQDLRDILALGKEQEAAQLAQNIDAYNANSKLNISANNFLDETINPVEIIKLCSEQLRTNIGRKPNTAIIGAKVYSKLLDHPLIIERIKFSGMRKVNVTVLSELFEIANISIGYAQLFDDSGFHDIWEDKIVLAYVDENEKTKRSEFNPSYGYTFQRKGKPEIDTYFENGGKSKIIRCTDNYALSVTCQEAAFLIYNCLTGTNA